MVPEDGSAPATRADVLVAGGGAAGLTAALAAAARGARVILAERSDELGGTTALSFGRVWVPASHHAPSDTKEAARAYLTGLFSGRYPEMADAFIAGAPEMARCPAPEPRPDQPATLLRGQSAVRHHRHQGWPGHRR
jgi:NADPH-dependent 2,4-dienoyl-CoA reductase/sulfur reductase-like enzyme